MLLNTESQIVRDNSICRKMIYYMLKQHCYAHKSNNADHNANHLWLFIISNHPFSSKCVNLYWGNWCFAISCESHSVAQEMLGE